MEANYSMPTLPLMAGGFGNNNAGLGGTLGGTALGVLFGALLGNGGLGLGGNNGLNTAINANQSGEIAGLQAGVANIQNALNTNSLQDGLIALSQSINASTVGINNGIADLSTAQQAGNFTTLSSINGLGRDVTAAQTQGIIQALNTANISNGIMQQGFNEIGRDTANATNQIIMSLNAMSAQNAACCCSIEKTITADGALTRALINDIESQRKNVEISDLKAQNSNLAQTINFNANQQAQTVTILNHLVPLLRPATAVV